MRDVTRSCKERPPALMADDQGPERVLWHGYRWRSMAGDGAEGFGQWKAPYHSLSGRLLFLERVNAWNDQYAVSRRIYIALV